jgi:DNA-binding CsgD family transcriptional regulator
VPWSQPVAAPATLLGYLTGGRENQGIHGRDLGFRWGKLGAVINELPNPLLTQVYRLKAVLGTPLDRRKPQARERDVRDLPRWVNHAVAPVSTHACAQETDELHTSVVVPHLPATARTLLGRNAELAVLDGVLDGARAGRGRVLVVRGEPGMGKSVLLDYVAEQASGCHLARAAGVECEAELIFAGLQQLLGASMLQRSEHLPGPQRDALRVVLGVQQGAAPDRFLVGLATLGLLSDVAEERPLVCLIDDVQWLDRASTQVLSFVARRLAAERIAMVFAVRTPSDEHELDGLPNLVVGGLGDHDARRLLASAAPGRLDEQVRDRIVAETRGNPLALLELPRSLTPAEMAGGFGLLGARTLSGRIEQSFLRRIESLPEKTRELLFVAAAEPVGDVALLLRALDKLGIGADAIVPAENEELVELGSRVRFRHPLVRSAAYRAAAPVARRRGHAALADATDPLTEPDRRAWHRAYATYAPDEAVAVELERSASRARARAGSEAAAAFLERAAELTPDPRLRGERALAAAQAKFDAGAPAAAEGLLAMAAMCPLEELDRARVDRLRAHIAFARTRGGDTPLLLSAAAKRLEPLDPELARETHLEALWAAVRSGRFMKAQGVLEAAEAAMAPVRGRSSRAIDLLLDGLITRQAQGYIAALPSMARALDAFQQEGFRRENIAWCWLACQLAMDLWNDTACANIASGLSVVARERAALTVLPLALNYSAAHQIFEGKFDMAEQLVDEAADITTATRNVPIADFSVLLAAWRGDRDKTYQLRAAVIPDATARGEGSAVEVAEWAAATLHIGKGEYADAVTAAQRAYDPDGLGFNIWVLPELIEAASRNGDLATARAAFEQLAERSSLSSTEWARGIEARSRALLTDGPEAEDLYREAIEELGRSRVVVHYARARLIYGEWLRREHRRVDAREQLKAAYAAFDAMDAQAFAERALRELLATGETVRKRTADSHDQLTSQEAQISRLARDGLTNPEIGEQLFLSHRTVEWHLRKVFTKLGISSRRELAEALGGSDFQLGPRVEE